MLDMRVGISKYQYPMLLRKKSTNLFIYGIQIWSANKPIIRRSMSMKPSPKRIPFWKPLIGHTPPKRNVMYVHGLDLFLSFCPLFILFWVFLIFLFYYFNLTYIENLIPIRIRICLNRRENWARACIYKRNCLYHMIGIRKLFRPLVSFNFLHLSTIQAYRP